MLNFLHEKHIQKMESKFYHLDKPIEPMLFTISASPHFLQSPFGIAQVTHSVPLLTIDCTPQQPHSKVPVAFILAFTKISVPLKFPPTTHPLFKIPFL